MDSRDKPSLGCDNNKLTSNSLLVVPVLFCTRHQLIKMFTLRMTTYWLQHIRDLLVVLFSRHVY